MAVTKAHHELTHRLQPAPSISCATDVYYTEQFTLGEMVSHYYEVAGLRGCDLPLLRQCLHIRTAAGKLPSNILGKGLDEEEGVLRCDIWTKLWQSCSTMTKW